MVNRGFSGYNSRWALEVLHSLLDPASTTDKYSMATISFGANDSVKPDDVQHCPVDEYRSNISAMVNALREHNPDISLILITPGTVEHTLWPTRHADQVSHYANAVREVGAAMKVPVADLWEDPTCLNVSLGDFSDGLHLSASGNEKVFNAVTNVIKRAYRGEIPNETHYPVWKELAGKSPEEVQVVIQQWKWGGQLVTEENEENI